MPILNYNPDFHEPKDPDQDKCIAIGDVFQGKLNFMHCGDLKEFRIVIHDSCDGFGWFKAYKL